MHIPYLRHGETAADTCFYRYIVLTERLPSRRTYCPAVATIKDILSAKEKKALHNNAGLEVLRIITVRTCCPNRQRRLHT